MAVPCLVAPEPGDRQQRETWQRLERLLCELFLVLRALLQPSDLPMGPSGFSGSGRRGGGPPPPPQGGSGGSGSWSPRTLSGGSFSCTSPSTTSTAESSSGQSKSPKSSTCSGEVESMSSPVRGNGHRLGCELRALADSLRQRRQCERRVVPCGSSRCTPAPFSTLSFSAALCRAVFGGRRRTASPAPAAAA